MMQALLTGGPRDGQTIVVDSSIEELRLPVAPIGLPHYWVDPPSPIEVHRYRRVSDQESEVVLFAHVGT